MPIRPENRDRYPASWKAMVAEARERSGDRCECRGQCGIVHDGAVSESELFEARINGRPRPLGPRCNARNGKPHPETGSTVVLTLAHRHGVPLEETSIERMFHACQRCHLLYDKEIHAANRSETVRGRKASGDLFGFNARQEIDRRHAEEPDNG